MSTCIDAHFRLDKMKTERLSTGDPVSHDDVDATDVGGEEGAQKSVKKREEKDDGETKPVEEKTGEKKDETDKQTPSPVKTSTRSSRCE